MYPFPMLVGIMMHTTTVLLSMNTQLSQHDDDLVAPPLQVGKKRGGRKKRDAINILGNIENAKMDPLPLKVVVVPPTSSSADTWLQSKGAQTVTWEFARAASTCSTPTYGRRKKYFIGMYIVSR